MAPRVVVEDPHTKSLMVLILRTLLEGNLKNPRTARKLDRMQGTVAVKAGSMEATLTFADGEVRIDQGLDPSADAGVTGSLGAFVKLGARSQLIRPVLNRSVRFNGNWKLLLKLMPILRVPRGTGK